MREPHSPFGKFRDLWKVKPLKCIIHRSSCCDLKMGGEGFLLRSASAERRRLAGGGVTRRRLLFARRGGRRDATEAYGLVNLHIN